jgi:photosystem II stability/assembly factor-like uncharacterized protein
LRGGAGDGLAGGRRASACGKAAYSTDGINWTTVEAGGFPNYQDRIWGIAYGNSTFVAVGNSGKAAYSTDNGRTWTATENTTFGDKDINGIAYGNDKFVAVGNSGKAAYSTDNGATWTAIADTTFGSTSTINGIAYGGGRFVAVGADGKAACSNTLE